MPSTENQYENGQILWLRGIARVHTQVMDCLIN
jgi:hypothetical protein